MSYYIISDELYHHGILGQKWGVRRYQNPDGSLTAAGRERYINSRGELTDYGKRELNYEQKRDIERQHPSYKTISEKLSSDKKLTNTLKSINKMIDDADSGKIKNEYDLLSYKDTKKLQNLNKAMYTRIYELNDNDASPGARRATVDHLEKYKALDLEDFLFNYGTFTKDK